MLGQPLPEGGLASKHFCPDAKLGEQEEGKHPGGPTCLLLIYFLHMLYLVDIDSKKYLKYSCGQHHCPQHASSPGLEQLLEVYGEVEEEVEQGCRWEDGKHKPSPLRRG